MKYKINKKLLIFSIFIVPPLFFSIAHIQAISRKSSVLITRENLSIIGPSKELPQNNPQEISKEEFIIRVITDKELETSLDNITRYSYLLDIQPNVIRHALFLQNSITAKISYLEDLNTNIVKHDLFDFTLTCAGKEINVQDKKYEIGRGLKLNDESNNDRELLNQIRKDCYYFPFGGFRNNKEKAIYFLDVDEISPDGRITLIIKPDLISKIIIFMAWYIFWLGFLILIREGPGRYLIKIKKNLPPNRARLG